MKQDEQSAAANSTPRLERIFWRFVAARSVSQLGSSIAEVTIPLVAAVTLGASATQIGLLLGLASTVQVALRPFFAIRAETAADRGLTMKRLELARVAVALLTPAAWYADQLAMTLLFVVTLASSSLSAAFGAYSAPYMTDVVPDALLERAGGSLSGATSVADVAGPGLASLLYRVLPLPVVLLIDALSYLVSALLLVPRRRRSDELTNEEPVSLKYAVQGFTRLSRGLPLVAMTCISALTFLNLAVAANLPTHGVNAAGLSPSFMALAMGMGAIGAIAGSAAISLLGGRLAFSTRLLFGVASMALSFVALIPFGMSSGAAGLSLIAYELLGSFGGVLAMVSFVMNVPRWVKRHEIARTMAAATLVPELGAMIGAPIGGVLGDTVGFLPLLVTSVGLAVAIALWSAVKTVADQSAA